jgi:pyruvate dehydrogenase E2 component (dihydrolipoamide acetyltransferase)
MVSPMPAFLVPPLPGGASMTVRRWLKQTGEAIAPGDVLLEAETQDALVRIESPASCVITDLCALPGSTVNAGALLAHCEDEPTTRKVPAPMSVVPILMPQAGNSMEEGVVLKWRVAVGDEIEAGQVICEIETDKATIDYEAESAGRLARIVAAEGSTAAVKTPIAYLAPSDDALEAYLAKKAGTSRTAEPREKVNAVVPAAPVDKAERAEGRASPLARRLSAERGIPLPALGTGPSGRVIKRDIENAAEGDASRKPMSKMRRAIGAGLTVSKQTVPHFYATVRIDAGPLLAYAKTKKAEAGSTLNDVIVLSVGRTIGKMPALRTRFLDGNLVVSPHADVGIAVALEDGLVVPVMLGVETRDLAGVAAESKRLVASARIGRIENMGRGVFTISNLGMFGLDDFVAIINPPECGILAVGAAREGVIVKGGAMRAGHVMALTLSADHRIIDGAEGARFLAALREVLENPSSLDGPGSHGS